MAEPPSYQLSWSAKAREELKQLLRKAHTAGIGGELIRIINRFGDRLSREPLEVGEVYRSRGVVEEHTAVQDFLAIDFAVDKQRKVVLVRSCSALSGHGL